ncbi:MAG: Fis family transcriptional regulator, partial [Terriglobales bacterium]
MFAETTRIVEMTARRAPLGEVLEAVCLAVERQLPRTLCSVLLMDGDGAHLRSGAAPSLPVDYSDAVDGLAIGPAAGSCGTAAFRKQLVVVADVRTDPLWKDFRD